MEDTCNFAKCTIARRLRLKSPDECPNFVESWWTPSKNDKKPKLVSDCAPKRTFLMIQDLYNRLMAVQESQEQQRNSFSSLSALAKALKGTKTGSLECLEKPREIVG